MILSDTLRKAYIQQRKEIYDKLLLLGREEDQGNILFINPNIESPANREYVRSAVKAGPYSAIQSQIDSKYYISMPDISNPTFTFTPQVCKNIILGPYSSAVFSVPFSGFIKLGEGAVFNCVASNYNFYGQRSLRENALAITSPIQVIGGDWCVVSLNCYTPPVEVETVLVKGGTFIFEYYSQTFWRFKARAIIDDLNIQIGDDHYIVKENTSCTICQQRSRKNYADYVKSLKDKEVKVGCTVA